MGYLSTLSSTAPDLGWKKRWFPSPSPHSSSSTTATATTTPSCSSHLISRVFLKVHPDRRLPVLLQDPVCTLYLPIIVSAVVVADMGGTRVWGGHNVQSKTEVGRLTIQPRNTKPADPAITGRANCLEVPFRVLCCVFCVFCVSHTRVNSTRALGIGGGGREQNGLPERSRSRRG